MFYGQAVLIYLAMQLWQPAAGAAGANGACSLVLLGRQLAEVPEALYWAEGEPEVTLGDMQLIDEHGRLQVLKKDKTRAYILDYSIHGPLRSVLSVSRKGQVVYYDFEQGFRNGARLGTEEGERLLSQFERLLQNGNPGSFLLQQIERRRPKITRLHQASRLWPKVEVLPATPWELNQAVASTLKQATGTLAFLVEAYGRKVRLLQFGRPPFDQIPSAELVLTQDGFITNEDFHQGTQKKARISPTDARDLIVEIVAILSQKTNPMAVSKAATHLEAILKSHHPNLFK